MLPPARRTARGSARRSLSTSAIRSAVADGFAERSAGDVLVNDVDVAGIAREGVGPQATGVAELCGGAGIVFLR